MTLRWTDLLASTSRAADSARRDCRSSRQVARAGAPQQGARAVPVARDLGVPLPFENQRAQRARVPAARGVQPRVGERLHLSGGHQRGESGFVPAPSRREPGGQVGRRADGNDGTDSAIRRFIIRTGI